MPLNVLLTERVSTCSFGPSGLVVCDPPWFFNISNFWLKINAPCQNVWSHRQEDSLRCYNKFFYVFADHRICLMSLGSESHDQHPDNDIQLDDIICRETFAFAKQHR